MRIGACLFLLGTVCLFQASVLPPPGYCLLFTAISLSLRRIPSVHYLGFFLAGYSWAMLYSLMLLSPGLEPGLEGRDLVVSGRVINLPLTTTRYQRFDLDIQEISDIQGIQYRLPGRTRLYWYAPYPAIVPGSHMRLLVRLKRAHGLRNPDGFDYEAWLFQNGIRSTGYVRQIMETTATVAGTDLLRYRLRQRLRSILTEDSPEYGLVLALLLGDRGGISQDQRQTLTRTGTGHLLAISGLHIGLVAGFAFVVVRRIWALWYRGTQLIPAQYIAAMAAMLTATFYAALAGFSVPTQRAMLMLVVILGCLLARRRPSTSHILALVLFAVLLINPVSVITAGFWLSFAAVAVIMLALGATTAGGGYNPWQQWLRIQVAVCLGLLPLQAYWFHEVSVWSIPANLIAIPWVSFVTLPVLMAGAILLPLSTGLAAVVLHAGAVSLGLLWQFLEILANTSFAGIAMRAPTLLVLAAAIVATVILLMPRGVPCRYLALFWLLPLFFPLQRLPLPGEYELTVLDTGQGLSVVARTRNHTLLYDTGPGFEDGFNAGRSIILPYLRAGGDRHIDTLVQSHGDNDHIGGLDAILDGMGVNRLLTSVPGEVPVPSQACQSGDSWTWDGVPFRILHPPAGHKYGGNNASCVLILGPPGASVLLSGDIERDAERGLMRRYDRELQATVLVVPHHGSKTSSSYGFIRAVGPESAIISAGYLNRFRLPNQDIIRRYVSRGVSVYNTATDGAIRIKFIRGYLFISTEREQTARFWDN